MIKNVNSKYFKISTQEFFKDYLNAVNGMLVLSTKDIVVLAPLLEQYNNIREKTTNNEIINELLFSSNYRSLASNSIGISTMNFNNYIASLKKKGVINDKGNGFMEINETILPVIVDKNSNSFLFTIEFNIQKEIKTNGSEQQRDTVSGENSREESVESALPPPQLSFADGEEEELEEDGFKFFEEPTQPEEDY
jgi:hypothetical protein